MWEAGGKERDRRDRESEKKCVCVNKRERDTTLRPTLPSLNNSRGTYTDTVRIYQATDGKQPRGNQMRSMFVIVDAINRVTLSSYGHYLTAVCTATLDEGRGDNLDCDCSAIINKIQGSIAMERGTQIFSCIEGYFYWDWYGFIQLSLSHYQN